MAESLAGRKLVQVALTCRDIDRARKFYRDTLGLTLLFETGTMLFFDCGGQRLMVGLAEQKDQPNGGSYFYFDATDILELGPVLAAKGVEFVGSAETVQRTDAGELKLRFFKDPDGNVLALMGTVKS
jgi:catechol 2,3-dioxygenase-like lactoylglutathione lyase family enzyme